MNDPDRAYSNLLEHVYQAAVEPTHWPEALARSAHWLGASRALLFTIVAGLREGGFFYFHGIDPEEMMIWNSRYVGTDFWTAQCIKRNKLFEGSIMLDQDLSSREELFASEYYREHLSRMQIAWLMGSIVLAPADGSLPKVACSFYRSLDEPAFDEDSRRKMSLLVPHLSRALGVMLRLRQADNLAAAGAAALDALGFGVVLLDARAKVVQANLEALRIWRTENAVACTEGQLRIANHASATAWESALLSTLGDGGAGNVAHFSEVIRVPKTSGEGAYLMQISRVDDASRLGVAQGGAKLIVFITDETRSTTPTADLLIKAYKLTPAEARCAQALGEGQLSLAAVKLAVSENTLRTQLKRVYQKTKCSNRAELTRLMLSLAGTE